MSWEYLKRLELYYCAIGTLDNEQATDEQIREAARVIKGGLTDPECGETEANVLRDFAHWVDVFERVVVARPEEFEGIVRKNVCTAERFAKSRYQVVKGMMKTAIRKMWHRLGDGDPTKGRQEVWRIASVYAVELGRSSAEELMDELEHA